VNGAQVMIPFMIYSLRQNLLIRYDCLRLFMDYFPPLPGHITDLEIPINRPRTRFTLGENDFMGLLIQPF
jgi:hypothetical protein